MPELKILEVCFLAGLALCQNLGENVRIYKIIPFFYRLMGCVSTTIMYGLFIAQERVLLTSKPQATTVKTYGRNWKQKCKLLCVLQFQTNKHMNKFNVYLFDLRLGPKRPTEGTGSKNAYYYLFYNFRIISICISSMFVCLICGLRPKDLRMELEAKIQIVIMHFTI